MTIEGEKPREREKLSENVAAGEQSNDNYVANCHCLSLRPRPSSASTELAVADSCCRVSSVSHIKRKERKQ